MTIWKAKNKMAFVQEVIFLLCFLIYAVTFCNSSSSTTETPTSTKLPILCYACFDTTDIDGNNRCKDDTEEMMYESGQWKGQLLTTSTKKETDKRNKFLGRLDFIQDCSSRGDNFTFCMIEEIGRGDTGRVSSFSRGCTDKDLSNFAPAISGLGPIVNMLRDYTSGNSTAGSVNSGTNFFYKVTICDTQFCNGPVPLRDDGKTINSTSFILMSILVYLSVISKV